ncbi:EamA family transporter [Nitrospinota bacterium]
MSGLFSHMGSGEFLAVASSLSYSATLIFLRRGMQTGSAVAAILLIDIIVGTASFAIAYALGTLQTASAAAVFWFALSGVAGAGIGTIAFFIGIERIGVSRSTTIYSASPIWRFSSQWGPWGSGRERPC